MINILQQNKFVYFFPFLLFLLNLISKGWYLTAAEVSHDEPFSIYHAQFNVVTIIEQLKGYNNPPLYEIVLHFWIKLFGVSAASVRALPLIFASLAPVALFYFGKKYFSKRAGMISSLLLSFSNLVTYHSHDSRVYTLFLLLSILSMHYFLELLTGQLPKLRVKVLFTLCSALLIYSHYFGFFVFFIQGIYLLIFYPRMIAKLSVYYAIIALLYVPHVVVLFSRFRHSVGGTWLEAPSGLESLYNMVWSFSNAPVVAVCCMALLVIGLVMSIVKKEINKDVFLVALWFLVPFLGMFFISYSVPMYIGRYLIYCVPAFYLLLALSADMISKNGVIRNVVTIILVVGFMVTTVLNPLKNTHVTELIKEINVRKTMHTAVIVCPFDFIDSFTYNYNREYFSEVSDQREYYLTDSFLKRDGVFFGCDSRSASGYPELMYVITGERSKSPQADTTGIASAGYKLQEVKQVDELTKLIYYKK